MKKREYNEGSEIKVRKESDYIIKVYVSPSTRPEFDAAILDIINKGGAENISHAIRLAVLKYADLIR